MIYITQLIYLIKGQEEVFDEFEKIAIPTIPRYNGRLVVRARPSPDDFIECVGEKPYEIHLVEFATDQDFTNYMQDEERKKFLHLKQQSIKSAVLIKGSKL